jgi:cellulose synthase/poly-beta-1,6-N-acetylglucosamine synthase-like glycosyltransferase
MTSVLIALALFWAALALHDLVAVRRLPRLPASPPDTAPATTTTRVDAVFAVRDDREDALAAASSLLAQRGVDLRVTAVDDRSTDGTGAALAALAARAPRLRVRSVSALPEGWLGKPHALQVGAADADAPWLLFADGDTRLCADAVARAVAAAEASGADHVCLLPAHRGTTWLGRACLLAFHLTVQRRVAQVNARTQRGFVGTGAFTLVRTAAYRRIGGHEALRFEVLDDVMLGALLFRAGCRSRVWLADDAFSIAWGRTPGDLVRVVRKNMFAVLRYRTWLAALAIAAGTALPLGALLAPLWAGPSGWWPFAAYAATGVPGALLARRMGWQATAGLATPITRLLLAYALLVSTATTLAQRGVVWRGTRYALADLRRRMVR